MLKIKIEFIKLYLIALFLLATNTTGFDVYYHAISAADYELINYYNPAWVVSGYELPRYILFHYFLWLITLCGILPLVPVLAIFYAVALKKVIDHNYSHELIKIAVVAATVFNIIFTSALGISMLTTGMAILYRKDRKSATSYLLICLGSALHPIGILVGFILLLVLRGWLYILMLAVLIHFSHMLTFFIPSNLLQHQRFFDLGDLMVVNSDIYEKVMDKLSVEAFALFILFAMYLSFVVLGKVREIRLMLNFVNQLVSTVSVYLIIYAMLVSALVKSYPAHLTTGGPLAIFSLQYETLPSETLNIISAAWVSPCLLLDSIKLNQFSYRGD